ncbi:hypothetical protein MKEN_00688900 [Mycena kentingensis (nom. inval.)]|nr:hypothetical protein MKEN_00688900 [Mycena kentingensis (nom. inval.)]
MNDHNLENDEAITALILSASQDEAPPTSLQEIYATLCQARSEAHLDALTILPPLLQTRRPGAKDIVALVGECGSAKEVVIAVQEALERVSRAFAAEEHEEGEQSTPAERLLLLIYLSSAAIPRLKLRKKTPSDTLRPLLTQLERTLNLGGSQLSRTQGREVINGVSQLVESAFVWCQAFQDDVRSATVILASLLENVVANCANSIQSGAAQRSFEKFYARLTVKSNVPSDWEAGAEAVQSVLTTYTSLGLTVKQPATPTVAYLVLLAHSETLPPEINRLLTFLLPILISSLQTTHALDETLSLLLRSFHAPFFAAGHQLLPDVSGPLCAILPTLASSHPDALTRHQAFRMLSRILALTPPELRVQILRDLVSDDSKQFPQMRVAAVGLVKESVLDALGKESASIFTSPHFLQVFGPVLLRPDPIDFFDSEAARLSQLVESAEPPRLVECLSLYYILLLRDKSNRTGIRDRDQIANVEKTLLGPLRVWVVRESELLEANDHAHLHAEMMPLVSLKTSLERVDAAVAGL